MDEWFRRIQRTNELPGSVTAALRDAGFAVIPGPLAGDAFERLAAAYDSAMTGGQGSADLRAGSSTTRLHDLVNRGSAFDPVYVYPPLLEACASIVGGPFRMSTMIGRTLRPGSGPEELHADLARDDPARPMAAFLLMVDEFRADNGATRFVPGSHRWPEVPENVMADRRAAYPGEVMATGSAGSLILFDASIWHGHTANPSGAARRSIQGYFLPRKAAASSPLLERMQADTWERLSPLARYVLGAPHLGEGPL